MQPGRSDLADFTYFLAIARHRNFRLAGLEVGVSASGLSHALKGLETRLGIRLLNRTSRSVTLTAAGEELRQMIEQPFAKIGDALEAMNQLRETPAGRIRLNVMEDAASLLLGPVLPTFIDRYPDVRIDVAVSNRMVDVIDGGFDAGIRYGGTVPEDMVAQRLSADIEWTVVASPAYVGRYGVPEHPNDLARHRCLGVRLGNDRIYRWEFERGEEKIEVAPEGVITQDGTQFARVLVLGGGVIAYLPAPAVAAEVRNGELVAVLNDWLTPGPGFHIYYSSRRQLPEGLRLLIDTIRELRPLGL
ncbi:LysR family transcriptional regulator [uncultured Sphingomonas sp.]|uniref:LysR family transcriptional regulator n=1 Tax=uncultured Sphingomonas sp. TaxID=158754 RepID=UPI0025E2B88B|nr:LysR family transcriptional regulator [uncultured Sphingomonas sp.]